MSSTKPDKAPRTDSAQFVSGETNTIFIVEDDEIDQRLVSQSFTKRISSDQINLRFFSSGEKLLSHLIEHKVWPSLLICDINLPGMTGLETIDQMKDLDLLDQGPFIVVLSGSDPTLDPQFRQSSNIGRYYQKPASKRDWDRIIDEICHLQLNDKKNGRGSIS
jgi:CheY-like chemotaxis protein